MNSMTTLKSALAIAALLALPVAHAEMMTKADYSAFEAGRRLLAKVDVLVLFRDALERFRAREWDAAEALYGRITEQAPEDAEGFRGLARARWNRGARSEALAAWERYCALKGLPAPGAGAVPGLVGRGDGAGGAR